MVSLSRLFVLFILAGLTAGCLTQPPGNPAEASPPPAALAPPPSQTALPTGIVTLTQAIETALAAHPDLAVLRAERAVRDGDILQAGLRENPRLALSYEDFGGSGDLAGVDGAETTLSISQEFPLNDVLAQRETVARRSADLLDWDLQTRAHELRGDVRVAFAEADTAQRRLTQRKLNEELVQRLVESVTRRVESGDVSPVERAKAQIDLSAARLASRRAELELSAAYARLAALWGASAASFEAVEAMPAAPQPPSLDRLLGALEAHPSLQRWQAERTVLEAELRLARAEARPSIEVSAGIRQFNESGDHAFLIEVGLPLPLFNRNQGAIAAAEAKLAGLETRIQAARRALASDLLPLHAGLMAQSKLIDTVRAELLPPAEATYEAVCAAYAAGQADLLELLDAERAVLTARGSLIEAETDYQALQAALEALLGTPLQTLHHLPPAPNQESR